MGLRIPETSKEYFLIVNSEELRQAALRAGFDGVTVFAGERFSDEDIHAIRECGKAVVGYCFEDDDILATLAGQLRRAEIPKFIDQTFVDYETLDNAVKHFPDVQSTEHILIGLQVIHRTDYTNRCGNCHEIINDNEDFCTYCGTRKGEGAFEPFYEPTVMSPYERYRCICEACGRKWVTYPIHNGIPKYCPMCAAQGFRIAEHRCVNVNELDWADEDDQKWAAE